MKFFNLLFCLLAAVPCIVARDVVVVDNEDGSTVVAASVFSNSGIIVGMTDADGRLSDISDTDYPLTVKCLGYEVGACSAGVDTLHLIPAAIELADVVVTPADRPVMHVLCYIREFSSYANSVDTMQRFSEHMADYYLSTQKVKKFKAQKNPRVLYSRHYARTKTVDGRDSIYRPDDSEVNSWVQLVSLPDIKVEESEAMKAGARTDTVHGKYCVKSIDRKTGSAFIQDVDYLADSKNHTESPLFFKLLGLTIDLKEMYTSWAYVPNDRGEYAAQDLIYGTMALKLFGRGKWIKKAFDSKTAVELNGLFEIYPVDIEYLTIEDANAQRKEKQPAVELKRCQHALPLPDATQRLVDIIDAQEKR